MTVPTPVEDLIRGAPLSAHLATSVDDRPHVAPVWYGYRDGTLYCTTGGKKLANVRRNPRVAVAIERAVDGDVAWTVTMLGRATVSDDPERMAWAREWIYDAYEGGSDDGDEGDAETGTGGSDGETEEGTDGADGDGATGDGDTPDYALVEIDVGSVSWSVYE